MLAVFAEDVSLGDIQEHLSLLQERSQLKMFDPSHILTSDPSTGGECCLNCWGCTCHSPELLKAPCKGLDFLKKEQN